MKTVSKMISSFDLPFWGRVSLSALAFLVLFSGCGRKKEPTPPVRPGATLYLSQAQFFREKGDDGKMHSVPGPARLEIYSYSETGWSKEVLEDPESNVFHKAAWFTPINGEPGILTIGATQAHLKIWRKKGGSWEAVSLWNPSFGGKFDRLRDFEVADVTGDGKDDIIIATHDQGVIAVASWKDGAYHAEEIHRKDTTFVHEIEVGDVDADGIVEFFTTPSRPNKLDGTIQPGEIDMFKFTGGEWIRRPVDILETRHAKEILCVTLTGEDRPVLFGSLEGEAIGGSQAGDSTKIRMYRFEGDQITPTDIASLPGQLCRFLTHGDTDGDGIKELIASTKSDGIWKLTPQKGESALKWKKELIATGTSGFEHATYLYDFSGDGIDELYVASDDQAELRRYWFNGSSYSMEVLGSIRERSITFNVTAHQF
ncbi:MAG: FG-GAP repeat domain-containing protein [Candidatus Glassbacteria bacterium]